MGFDNKEKYFACDWCGKLTVKKSFRKKYCCDDCLQQSGSYRRFGIKNKAELQLLPESKKCEVCGKEFYKTNRCWKGQKYCSKQCRKKAQYEMEKEKIKRVGKTEKRKSQLKFDCAGLNTKNCKYCGIKFTYFKQQSNYPDQIYCGKTCRQLYFMRGLSKEEYENQTSMIKVCKWCNKDYLFTKKNRLTETCGSKECKSKHRVFLTIRNSYDISLEQYNELTKKCYFCEWEDSINVHHIIPKSEGGSNNVENYINLCPNHHRLVHNTKTHILKKNILTGKWEIIKKNEIS